MFPAGLGKFLSTLLSRITKFKAFPFYRLISSSFGACCFLSDRHTHVFPSSFGVVRLVPDVFLLFAASIPFFEIGFGRRRFANAPVCASLEGSFVGTSYCAVCLSLFLWRLFASWLLSAVFGISLLRFFHTCFVALPFLPGKRTVRQKRAVAGPCYAGPLSLVSSSCAVCLGDNAAA